MTFEKVLKTPSRELADKLSSGRAYEIDQLTATVLQKYASNTIDRNTIFGLTVKLKNIHDLSYKAQIKTKLQNLILILEMMFWSFDNLNARESMLKLMDETNAA